MLKRTRLSLLLCGMAFSAMLVTAGPAAADPTPRPTGGVEDCGLDICVGAGTGTGTGGGGGGGGTSGGSTGGSSDKSTTCEIGGQEVPCQHAMWGTFSGGCYYKLADPQPDASSDYWGGHKPGDGAIYMKSCPPASIANGDAGPIIQGLVWLAESPGGQVDPAVLAQQAMDKMTLRGPDIGMAPQPGSTGVVGMPVWMWTEVAADTWGPNTASASVPGLTVTATARAKNIVWHMGDGTSVTCTSAGTPYQKTYGKKKSPDCGHTYRTTSARQNGQKFTITATTTWNVHWEGGGQSGDLTTTRSSGTTARIGEVQVVGD